MAQISIDTLNRERVILIVDIEDMPSWKDYIQIPIVSIGTIPFRLRSCIHHLLDRLGGFVPAYNMTHNLTWLSAYHRYNVDIFSGFCSGPAL